MHTQAHVHIYTQKRRGEREREEQMETDRQTDKIDIMLCPKESAFLSGQ